MIYTRTKATTSYCPRCGQNPTLLMGDDAPWPAFYICWTCKEIREIGVGLVREFAEDNKEERLEKTGRHKL